jgi:glyoxylase-like metal-dependent hydrolase (beta-lactamase superfamily II)
MLSWTVGDITIKRIVEFETAVPYNEQQPFIRAARPEALQEMPWLRPHFVTSEGHLMSSVHALLVEAPGLRLVVDTCIGNDRPRRMTGGRALSTAFLASLNQAGWSRESVDTVVCTHLHVDHVGWNTMLDNGRWVPTFPNARYLIGRSEFDYWSRSEEPGQQQIMSDSIQPILDAGLVEFVELDHQLSDCVRLVPSPGHTPGHVSVLIESQGALAMITGDFIHHPCQMGRTEWATAFDYDVDAATEMRRKMLEGVADQPILVIGTHFSTPTAGYVKRDGANYRFETT